VAASNCARNFRGAPWPGLGWTVAGDRTPLDFRNGHALRHRIFRLVMRFQREVPAPKKDPGSVCSMKSSRCRYVSVHGRNSGLENRYFSALDYFLSKSNWLLVMVSFWLFGYLTFGNRGQCARARVCPAVGASTIDDLLAAGLCELDLAGDSIGKRIAANIRA